MKKTRITVRNVDQEVMDRVRLHIRRYGISLGGIDTAALVDHMDMLERFGASDRPPLTGS